LDDRSTVPYVLPTIKEKRMICAYRYPEGISLNGREYLLDEGELAIFETEEELVAFINDHNWGDPIKNVGQLEDFGIYLEEADIAVEDWYEE
jgi:hypothetical protein